MLDDEWSHCIGLINGAKRGGRRATLRYQILGHSKVTVSFWVFLVPVSILFISTIH